MLRLGDEEEEAEEAEEPEASAEDDFRNLRHDVSTNVLGYAEDVATGGDVIEFVIGKCDMCVLVKHVFKRIVT